MEFSNGVLVLVDTRDDRNSGFRVRANDNSKLSFSASRVHTLVGKMPENTSSSSLFGRLSTSTRSSFMSPKDVRCTVHLLHDSDMVANEFPRSQPAQTILDYICDLKNIQEKDFLGLRYQDHNKHRYWLDLTRSIGHSIKHFKKEVRKIGKTESLSLHLRFRYYPADPTKIRDPNLRYQLFVQLQRDLLHGRLYCPQSQGAELAALILQAQIGDYNEETNPANYVSGYKLLLRQTPKLEERIADIHRHMKGKSSAEAELEFLEKASLLDTYAFDPYTIKDPKDPSHPVFLGASAKGILIYNGTSRTHQIDWSEVKKTDYYGKDIKITVSETYLPPAITEPSSRTGTMDSRANGNTGSPNFSAANQFPQRKGAQTLKYVCPSAQFAKHLWIHILSQQAFFNESSAQDVKLQFSKPAIPLLSRGSTFRFPSRRVYREIESSDDNSSTLPFIKKDGKERTNHELNTSTVSEPNVIRYELPRQEMRVEQPWLNKTTPVLANEATSAMATGGEMSASDHENNNHINNNKIMSTNLNVSLEAIPKRLPTHDDTPSTSDAPEFVHTISPSNRNQTSFTVHLVRREASRCNSPNTCDEHDTDENRYSGTFEDVLNTSSPGAPLASSTPRNKEMAKEKIVENLDAIPENGDVKVHSNGHTVRSEETPKPSIGSKIANVAFASFLMLVLTIVAAICLFEKSDGATNDWIEGNKQLSQIRHLYYEPARHYVVEQHRKLFASK